MTFGHIIAVLLTLFVLFLCLLTFVGIPQTHLSQDRSRLLGYPVWHPPLIGRDDNKTDGALFFSSLFMFISAYLGFRWTSKPPTSRKLQSFFISGDSAPVSTYGFNRILVLYVFITMLTLSFVLVVDIGKIWVAVGILHNATEFAILVFIGSGGRIKSHSLWGILCCYYFFVYSGALFIDWPFDAVWFKFQGLCFDYALMITFTRIYFKTKHELSHGNAEDLTGLTNNDELEPEDHDGLIQYPRPLLLLVFASVIHNVGNLTATVSFDELIPSILTTLTYAVTFPAYMLYVYLDTHGASIYPQKRIYLPDTPFYKKFIIATISLCCSLLTVRLGAFLQARKEHQGDGNFGVVYY